MVAQAGTSAFAGSVVGGSSSRAGAGSRGPAVSRRVVPTAHAGHDHGPLVGLDGKPLRYCADQYKVTRRKTSTVQIGKVMVGSDHPIALQTMTTTDTMDVAATVDQVMRCADAGSDMVRITVQGRREAEACMKIREKLFQNGYETPLVADIHFQPKVAMMVAEAFEKIRVNPGNFADGRKTFDQKVYDDASYAEELAYIEDTFTPLVLKCKELGRALRIGTNHGSLSARTLSYYGDTPAGMVESAFEFARICASTTTTTSCSP